MFLVQLFATVIIAALIMIQLVFIIQKMESIDASTKSVNVNLTYLADAIDKQSYTSALQALAATQQSNKTNEMLSEILLTSRLMQDSP